jgi:hypothetical protein
MNDVQGPAAAAARSAIGHFRVGQADIPARPGALHRDPGQGAAMIRKLTSGQFRLYSRKTDPRTGKRKNLGTFKSRAAAEAHERAVQYFKRH